MSDVEQVKVKAKDLDPNLHGLFNGNGARHKISEVVVGKPWVKSVRDDGWVDYFGRHEIVTVWLLTPKL